MGFSTRADWGSEMDGSTRSHRFRYHLGRGFVKPGDTVLDLGCGKGYGSQILSEVAEEVIGFDIDAGQINNNIEEFDEENILFLPANLEESDLPHCDVACSFEVIEHLYKPAEFIERLKTRVKKWIVVSVPIGEEMVEVDGEIQGKKDSTHHFSFPTSDDLDALFIDDNWRKFYGVQSGVTYIAVYYKYDL